MSRNVLLALVAVGVACVLLALFGLRSDGGIDFAQRKERPARSVERSDAPATLAPETREAVVGPTRDVPAREAIQAFRIEGRVASRSGEPLYAPDVRLVLRDAAQKASVHPVRLGGAFEIGPLEPGEYLLEANAPEHETGRRAITLAGVPRVESVEFELTALTHLLVRVRTREGRSIREELMSSRAWNYSMPLYAMALRESPREAGLALADMEGEGLAHYSGMGVRSSRSPFGQEVSPWRGERWPDDAIGFLTLRELPMHVALVHSSLRVASRRVTPGEREVVFTLSLDELEALVPAVRMRVVSAETGEPLRGAFVNRAPSDGPHGRELVAEDGVYRRLGLDPGRVRFVITCQGYARREIEFEARAATQVELGDVALERGRSVRGVLTGGVEIGRAYWVELVPIDSKGRIVSQAREGVEVTANMEKAAFRHEESSMRRLEAHDLTFSADDLAPGRWVLRNRSVLGLGLDEAASSATGNRWVSRNRVDRSQRSMLLPAGAVDLEDLDWKPEEDEALVRDATFTSMHAIELDFTETRNVEVEARFAPAGILRVAFDAAAWKGARIEILDARGLPAAEGTLSSASRAYVALPRGSYTLIVQQGGSEPTRIPVHIGSNLERVTLP